jgi:hypothetical protein
MHRDEIERHELVQELPILLAAVQQMGQALTNKSHGAEYRLAWEFNELLHMARLKLDEIQLEAEVPEDVNSVAGSSHAQVLRPRFF